MADDTEEDQFAVHNSNDDKAFGNLLTLLEQGKMGKGKKVTSDMKLALPEEKKQQIYEWVWQRDGKCNIGQFHSDTNNEFLVYKQQSVAGVFRHAVTNAKAGKLPDHLSAQMAGKRQAEAASLIPDMQSILMKKARLGANLCNNEVTPVMTKSSSVVMREALHGEEPPLYKEDEREWIPSTSRVFECTEKDQNGNYHSMIGIRLSLPRGVTPENVNAKVHCGIVDGYVFEYRVQLSESIKESKNYYAFHHDKAEAKMMEYASKKMNAEFRHMHQISKNMDRWMDAEAAVVNEERNTYRENQQYVFYRFYLEKECTKVLSIEHQSAGDMEDDTILVKVIVKRDDVYEEPTKAAVYNPAGSPGKS